MALHTAVQQNQLQQVKQLLLTAAADVNEVDPAGRTPLFLAADIGSPNIVSALLAAGSNVNVVDTDGFTPMHQAAGLGHHQVVQMLLAARASVDAVQKHGSTLLHLAAWRGHTKVVQLLLAAAANVDVVHISTGVTPLHQAALQGHHQLVQMLLAAGASVDAVNTDGSTPLHLAAWQGHTQVVLLLLAAAANVDAVGPHGGMPLHMAAATGQHEVVELLLAAGASINAADTNGCTALHHAAMPVGGIGELLESATAHGQLEVAAILIRRGADQRLRNHSMNATALHKAAQAGHTAMVKLLFEARGKPGVHPDDLIDAAKLAAFGQHMAACAWLVMQLRRLWPAKLPQLFEGEYLVSAAQAVAAVISEYEQDAISLDQDRAALRQSQANVTREKVALQHLEREIIVQVAGMGVVGQGQLDDTPNRWPIGLWTILRQKVLLHLLRLLYLVGEVCLYLVRIIYPSF